MADDDDDGRPRAHEEQRCEPRYDPKELRDAARILAPFLGLIKDTNNPYARLVAREVCKTYYRVLHPDERPADVLRAVDWDAKYERSQQVWTEFWLYVPGSKFRDWVSLRTTRADDDDDVADRPDDDRTDSNQPYTTPVRHSHRRRRRRSRSRRANILSDDACSNIFDVSPPNVMYDRDVMSTGPGPRRSRADRYERRLAGADACTSRARRSGCRGPGVEWCGGRADRLSDRCRKMKPSSLPPLPCTPVEPERRTNALDRSATWADDDDDDEGSDSADSQYNAEVWARDANKVAEAFAGMSSAGMSSAVMSSAGMSSVGMSSAGMSSVGMSSARQRQEKNNCSVSSTCPNRPARRVFDDDEWNDNVFNDIDFVRLLPFYELVHNQIEYVASEQQQYSLNMLDDIMPVLYHIHYELGDPRLKNDMLVEHVNLITRNTWERYFYNGTDRMPAAPESHQLYYPPSPLDVTAAAPPESPRPRDDPSSTLQHAVPVAPYRLPPCEPSTSSQNTARRPCPKEPKPPNRRHPPEGPERSRRRTTSKTAADDVGNVVPPETRKSKRHGTDTLSAYSKFLLF